MVRDEEDDCACVPLPVIMPNLPFSVFACYELNLDLARGYIYHL